jgi:hypothetical protein
MTLAMCRDAREIGLNVKEFAGCNARADATCNCTNDQQRDHDAIDIRARDNKRTHTRASLEARYA